MHMEDYSKYDLQSRIYLSEKYRAKAIWELLVNANIIFDRTYVLSNLNQYSEELRSDEEKTDVYWNSAHYENLIDAVRISLAFENYNKAILLSKGYVVHKLTTITNDEIKKLKKEQEIMKAPIPIETLIKVDTLIQEEPGWGKYFLMSIGKKHNNKLSANFKTISYLDTLSEKYQSIIKTPSDFIHLLKSFYKRRNQLHFLIQYPGAFKVESHIEILAQIKEIGNSLLKEELKKAREILVEF